MEVKYITNEKKVTFRFTTIFMHIEMRNNKFRLLQLIWHFSSSQNANSFLPNQGL